MSTKDGSSGVPSGQGEKVLNELIAAWLKTDEHSRTLLAAIDLESLLLSPRPRARSIGKMFAHLVSVRLRRVGLIGGPGYLEEIEPLAEGDEESRDVLDSALRTSAELVARLARERLSDGKTVEGFAGGVPAFLAYLSAHDAHHRGQILALLAHEKVKVSDEVAYGIWDWS